MPNKKESDPRGWGFIEELLNNQTFLNEVEAARSTTPLARPAMIATILMTFGVPSRYFGFIHHYVETKTIDKKLISEPISVVSDIDRTAEPTTNDPHEEWRLMQYSDSRGVYLKLSHDVTQPELKKFINDNWTKLIKPRLKRSARDKKRLGYVYYPEKDREIYDTYLNRKKLGLTIVAIQYRYGISRNKLNSIKRRQEKGPK